MSAWLLLMSVGMVRVAYCMHVDPAKLTQVTRDRLKVVPLPYAALEITVAASLLGAILYLAREGGLNRAHLLWLFPVSLVLLRWNTKAVERLARRRPSSGFEAVHRLDLSQPMRYGSGLALFLLTGLAAAFALASSQLTTQLLLGTLTFFCGVAAVDVVFGHAVAGAISQAALSGALVAGGVTLLGLDAAISQVAGGVLTYVAWLGFSASIFGTPIIIVPFPPFIIFAWRTLSEQMHAQLRQRWLALGSLVGAIALCRLVLENLGSS
jgi:hypothetical protein